MNAKQESESGQHVAPLSTLANTSQKAEIAARILSGLLASGHYTELAAEQGEELPRVKRWDAGEDWKAEGFDRRQICHAIDDAIDLMEDLLRRISKSATS